MIDALDHEQIVGLPARLQQPLGEPARVVSRKRRGEGNGRRRRKGEGLGVGTIRAICQTASRVLEFATQMGWRGGAKVPLPKVAVPDSEWLSIDELESLLELAGDHRIAYMLGARVGLRRGEIVELRWKDVDLANARLRVSRAYKRLDNLEWTVGPTKGPSTTDVFADRALGDTSRQGDGQLGVALEVEPEDFSDLSHAVPSHSRDGAPLGAPSLS